MGTEGFKSFTLTNYQKVKNEIIAFLTLLLAILLMLRNLSSGEA
jgi:hypothetical protein